MSGQDEGLANRTEEDVNQDDPTHTDKLAEGENDHTEDPTPRPTSPVSAPESSLSDIDTTNNPEANSRPKSSCSGEVVFTAKRRRKTNQPMSEDAHNVTFTVSIALAIPTEEDSSIPDIKDLMKRKKRVFEAPRAQSYYHLEYYLLPDDEEPIKTDVVTYGIAAKLYMERHDPRVLKTWQDGDVTWVAWTHSHCVSVTKSVLLGLFNHTLKIRIWDSKDKCSTRARFDRPKAFRIPQAKPGEDPEELGGVKSQVNKLTQSFESMQPKKACFIRPLPSHITVPREAGSRNQRQRVVETEDGMKDAAPVDKKVIPQDETLQENAQQAMSPHKLVSLKDKNEPTDARTFSRLGQLAGFEASDLDNLPMGRSSDRSSSQKKRSAKRHSFPGASPSLPGKSPIDSCASLEIEKTGKSPLSRRKARLDGVSHLDLEKMKKNGICVIPVRMAILFSGCKNLTYRLDEPVAGVEDCFVSVVLDGPLMSEKQKKDLNPLIIKVHSATNLPDKPLTYEQLENRCNPVFCKYKFYKMPEHQSVGRLHSQDIYWDDINVCLTGILEPSEFRQYLNGPLLEIEIHDRSRKQDSFKVKPALFGDDLEDEKINNVGTVTSRRTIHNAFHERDRPWDPYGVSKIDLSELLLGNKFLSLKVPIHNCESPDILGSTQGPTQQRVMGVDGAVDGPVSQPLPVGNYMEANSTLKVTVELAYPLISNQEISSNSNIQSSKECPFGRLVYKFTTKNKAFWEQLRSAISSINASALHLDDLPGHVIQAALSTYKLSSEEQKSIDLDILTGFHILDGDLHVFVVEGLQDKAITTLWNMIPQPENQDVSMLYNSDYLFSNRLYGSLDVDICVIKLHEPLNTIMEQPLLYVRDMVPKLCFKALTKLKELGRCGSMKEAVRNELFPTADMVISMSKEFGVPLTAKDFQAMSSLTVESTQNYSPAGVEEVNGSRYWTPIDNYNHKFVETIETRHAEDQKQNFIQENINKVKYCSDLISSQCKQPKVISDVTVPHNYSSQTLNSTELAKEKLRQQLNTEKPNRRFTYCPTYHHSMTVVPENPDVLKKEADIESQTRWKTLSGWIYPGVKSGIECFHTSPLATSRVEELQQPWEENVLHWNVLKPTLERNKYAWSQRHKDMELYQGVKNRENYVKSIQYGGDQLEKEQQKLKAAERKLWFSKLIGKNPHLDFHRRLPATELRHQGHQSSNQLDKLEGLLKDSPVKLTLKEEGLIWKNIPPIQVLDGPKDDSQSEQQKGFCPGPCEGHRWTREDNKIPVFFYNHNYFQTTNGQDFRLINKNHEFVYKPSEESFSTQTDSSKLGYKASPLPPIQAGGKTIHN